MISLVKSEAAEPETAQVWGRPLTLARILVDAGKLSSEEISRSQKIGAREKLPLGRVLVRDGFILSRDIATLGALHLGLPMVDLRRESIDPEAVALVPEEVARRYIVLPVKDNGDTLSLAVSDPTDLKQAQDMSSLTGRNIELVVSTQEDILEHIDLYYRVTQNLASEVGTSSTVLGGRVTSRQLREAPPAQVIELLLRQAVQDRASDIHMSRIQGGFGSECGWTASCTRP